jgi:aspartate/tyrosine/aromatic aminotransferase
MAKYKELYEEAIRDLNNLNLIISNLEDELKNKNKIINELNSKIKNELNSKIKKNKLKGVKFKNGFFWKDGIKYQNIQQYFLKGSK